MSKIGKKPCATVELLILKNKEKYIVIASDLISIRKDTECKQSLTNPVEYLIKDVFNRMKKENPQLKLENFIWIEHLYERGDYDTLPEEFSLVTPSDVMFDSKGYISSLKPSWLCLIMDDIEPEKRKGISLEEALKKLKELKIL